MTLSVLALPMLYCGSEPSKSFNPCASPHVYCPYVIAGIRGLYVHILMFRFTLELNCAMRLVMSPNATCTRTLCVPVRSTNVTAAARPLETNTHILTDQCFDLTVYMLYCEIRLCSCNVV